MAGYMRSPISSFSSTDLPCFLVLSESMNMFFIVLIRMSVMEVVLILGELNSVLTSANYIPVMLSSSYRGANSSALGEINMSDITLSECYSKYLSVPLRANSSLKVSPKSLVKICRC